MLKLRRRFERLCQCSRGAVSGAEGWGTNSLMIQKKRLNLELPVDRKFVLFHLF